MKERQNQRKKRKKRMGIRDRFQSISWLNKIPMDYNLFFNILFLIVFGVVMIYSASYYYSRVAYGYSAGYFASRQAIFALIGVVAMIVVSYIDYHKWWSLSFFAFPAAVLLVLLLKTPLGHASHEAVRWLRIGPIQFQVAEVVKLCMIMFFAAFITKFPVRHQQNMWMSLGLAAFISLLVFLISDNLSTAIIIMGICTLLIFISHPRTKPFILIFLGGLAFVALAVFVIVLLFQGKEANFRVVRILAWLHPTDPLYAGGTALQASQSLYAIGSGGVWGRGLGQSLIKFKMPEPHNDFILAVIAEELGIIGVGLLLFLFGYMLYRLYIIARNAQDLYGSLIAAGVLCQVGLQVILNIAVVTSMMPTTGITLPFISYGGASVVFLLVELGIVFSVDKYARDKKLRKMAAKKVERSMRTGQFVR